MSEFVIFQISIGQEDEVIEEGGVGQNFIGDDRIPYFLTSILQEFCFIQSDKFLINTGGVG
jgi:hypothetical protein